jgi:sugar phosphate isomerase/epimerase
MNDMILSTNVPYKMIRNNIQRIIDLQIGIEVYFNNNVIDSIGTDDVREVSAILKGAGIVCTVHAPFMDLSPGGVDRAIRAVTKDKLKKSVEMANILNARGIVCHGGYNKWYFDGHKQVWLDASLDTWQEILQAAGKDLPVMIENIFEEEPSTLIELFGHFRDKELYYCFDSGHFNLFSIVSIEEWLAPLKGKIREMHLHDNHGTSDEHLPVGMGTFPFRELKPFVKELGDVIYTSEIHGEARAIEGIKKLKEFLS